MSPRSRLVILGACYVVFGGAGVVRGLIAGDALYTVGGLVLCAVVATFSTAKGRALLPRWSMRPVSARVRHGLVFVFGLMVFQDAAASIGSAARRDWGDAFFHLVLFASSAVALVVFPGLLKPEKDAGTSTFPTVTP